MSDSESFELGKNVEKKAKTSELEDGYMADGELEITDRNWNCDCEVDDDFDNSDPLFVFGSEIMMIILNMLDARSVAQARLVNRGWREIASSDKIWDAKCQELWVGKAHIPRISKVQGLPKLAAYSLAITDAKRIRITRHDLCDHAWEFHFTEAAPEYWRNLDPHWSGTGPRMRRYFHHDGSITADPDDRVWGGHESCYTIVTGVFEVDKRIREHYVRINRWPQISVQRKEDWSWELSNHLYFYSSVPDAEKEGGTGPFFPIL